jgi:SnoaL-like domain
MDEIERLAAVDAIKQVKARYFRGVDTGDAELVRSVLAEDCELDYVGCCADPATGRDFFPAMNVVMKGNASWSSALADMGIVSVHQGHNAEIEILSETRARAIWSMTDRMYVTRPNDAIPFTELVGHGHYHETYEKLDGVWKIRTTHITRLRVEAK